MTRFIAYHFILFTAFVVPQMLLELVNLYDGKLRVVYDYSNEFPIGMLFVVLYLAIFFSAAAAGLRSFSGFRRTFLRLENWWYFRYLCIGITILCYALLPLGIGVKLSYSSLNFVIMAIPREMLLIVSTLGVLLTNRPLWKLLLLANVVYWVLIGSKSSLFLVFVAAFYATLLCNIAINRRMLLWGLAAVPFLPLTFVLPKIFLYGGDLSGILSLLASVDEAYADIASRMTRRVAWFDGLFLTPADAAAFRQVNVIDILNYVLAGLMPGIQAAVEPLGKLVIGLYNAVNLSFIEFAGGIGTPGVLKMVAYSQGFLRMLALAALFWCVHFTIFSLVRSTNPATAMAGLVGLVISLKSLVIGGNIDIAMARVLPMMVFTFAYISAARMLLRADTKRSDFVPRPVRN